MGKSLGHYDPVGMLVDLKIPIRRETELWTHLDAYASDFADDVRELELATAVYRETGANGVEGATLDSLAEEGRNGTTQLAARPRSTPPTAPPPPTRRAAHDRCRVIAIGSSTGTPSISTWPRVPSS